mmetsp:Transcript_19627/g.52319  ORF Transcript_19627/g.52319 Transcript_19627/m.52319 type:complete len:205 (+) Transcript_19627:1100-1714(+)
MQRELACGTLSPSSSHPGSLCSTPSSHARSPGESHQQGPSSAFAPPLRQFPSPSCTLLCLASSVPTRSLQSETPCSGSCAPVPSAWQHLLLSRRDPWQARCAGRTRLRPTQRPLWTTQNTEPPPPSGILAPPNLSSLCAACHHRSAVPLWLIPRRPPEIASPCSRNSHCPCTPLPCVGAEDWPALAQRKSVLQISSPNSARLRH